MPPTIANDPAGRLRDILSVVRDVPGNITVSEVWTKAAAVLIPTRGDVLAVRAEAGALYNSVETAINAMAAEHDREAYRAYRHTWAKPIFGIGLVDSSNHHVSGQALVSLQAIHTLTMLSSTLRSESPEPRIAVPDEQFRQNLEAVYDTLGRIHMEVSTTAWFDRRARTRLLTLVAQAMDSVVFVGFRGAGALERSVLTVEGELVASEGQLGSPGGLPDSLRLPWHEQVLSWLDEVRPIVRHLREMVEYDFVPMAAGLSVGFTSGDVPAALAAWIAGRVALEGRHPAPAVSDADRRRMLPPIDGGDVHGDGIESADRNSNAREDEQN